MFATGDYVINGNNGICLVSDITTLDISGVDKNRKYYLLKPVFASGSTVYVPVDTAEKTMRKAVSREEALTVIAAIPDIPLIPVADEKTLERTYKEYIRQNSCEGWIKLIKTIYLRKEKRIMKGCKVTAVDSKYFKQAEDYLYGEFSVALDMTKDEVRTYIEDTLNKEN
ncbi:MAG: CarD family transcriptional regulator [Lachnospiraceae bacterium]|nr:CarD family transcriptional regulator [Lachnospiraceae bacterium]